MFISLIFTAITCRILCHWGILRLFSCYSLDSFADDMAPKSGRAMMPWGSSKPSLWGLQHHACGRTGRCYEFTTCWEHVAAVAQRICGLGMFWVSSWTSRDFQFQLLINCFCFYRLASWVWNAHLSIPKNSKDNWMYFSVLRLSC